MIPNHVLVSLLRIMRAHMLRVNNERCHPNTQKYYRRKIQPTILILHVSYCVQKLITLSEGFKMNENQFDD